MQHATAHRYDVHSGEISHRLPLIALPLAGSLPALVEATAAAVLAASFVSSAPGAAEEALSGGRGSAAPRPAQHAAATRWDSMAAALWRQPAALWRQSFF